MLTTKFLGTQIPNIDTC